MAARKPRIRGSIVAMITPFKNGGLDRNALKKIIDFQIKNGTDAILPCGTTGESATLSHGEHMKMIEWTIDIVHGRVPVIAGSGSNSTTEAVELTRHAAESGCAAALLISPYYNKPTQRGLIEHFTKIADEVKIPQILYNIPGRTAVNINPETLATLSKHPNIVGVKEATGNISQMVKMFKLLEDNGELDNGFSVLAGDDALTYTIMSLGGSGVISAVANIAPRRFSDLVRAFENGDLDKARRIQFGLLDLVDAAFLETNPIPVKTACALMGLCKIELRLPMTRMQGEPLKKLKAVLEAEHVL